MAAAILARGDAAPIRFTEDERLWDFEFVLNSEDRCNADGCTLARAFFPDCEP